MKAMILLLSCLALAQTAVSTPAAPPATPGSAGKVYVIPIVGVIDDALIYVIRRGLDEAEAERADAIVFDMDTPGGRLDSAEEILNMLHGLKVPTYTFVNPNAISAGAIIAMGTDHIYMAPGSRIGDAMPIMISFMGDVQEMPASIEEKSVSYVAALMRAAAQQKGHDPQLAEAMVRRDTEYKIGDDVISKKGQLLTLTNHDAERPVGPERKPLLSSGTVEDLDALLDVIGKADCDVIELTVTSAERVARWIESVSVILLGLGLLGLYIEFKTPGFGLPGILGLLLLAVWFWGSHIAGLAGLEEVTLFLLGLALVLIEIFFIPGFGWAGITGIVLILVAILMGMVDFYPGEPWIPTFPKFRLPLVKLGLATILATVGVLLAGRFLPRTRLFQRLVLEASTAREQGFAASPETVSLVGLTGVAQTPLRPGGVATFGARRLDVVSRGDFLPAGAEIVIAEAHGNRIIVEPFRKP
jgi:membrane-bound serine protease (ClpP class)